LYRKVFSMMSIFLCHVSYQINVLSETHFVEVVFEYLHAKNQIKMQKKFYCKNLLKFNIIISTSCLCVFMGVEWLIVKCLQRNVYEVCTI